MGRQKKRKQHYVWEHYLKAWSTAGKVWCRRAGRVFHTSTENVAQQRDFYRLMEMSETDLAFVEAFAIDGSAPHLRETARGWIAPFHALFVLKQQYEANGRHLPEFEKALDIEINNLEEDLHAKIEARAIPILDALRCANTSFTSDEESFIHFCWFIAAQHLRTPGMAHRSRLALGSFSHVNVEACWGLLRTIFSTNIGYGLFERRRALRTSFLQAGPGAAFITGDQPIVNLRADGATPPTELELFYPLAPNLAVTFAFDAAKPETIEHRLTSTETIHLNHLIEKAAHEQVYAATRKPLEGAGK